MPVGHLLYSGCWKETHFQSSHEGRFVSLGREACFCICALCECTPNNRHLLEAPVPGKQREDLISTTSSPSGCLLWKHLGKAALRVGTVWAPGTEESLSPICILKAINLGTWNIELGFLLRIGRFGDHPEDISKDWEWNSLATSPLQLEGARYLYKHPHSLWFLSP